MQKKTEPWNANYDSKAVAIVELVLIKALQIQGE